MATIKVHAVAALTSKLAGGGVSLTPLGFLGLKFLPLDKMPNDFAQLFLDNDTNWVTSALMTSSYSLMENGVCCQTFDFLNKND